MLFLNRKHTLHKNIFRINCVDKKGKRVLNQSLHRDNLLRLLTTLPQCAVAWKPVQAHINGDGLPHHLGIRSNLFTRTTSRLIGLATKMMPMMPLLFARQRNGLTCALSICVHSVNQISSPCYFIYCESLSQAWVYFCGLPHRTEAKNREQEKSPRQWSQSRASRPRIQRESNTRKRRRMLRENKRHYTGFAIPAWQKRASWAASAPKAPRTEEKRLCSDRFRKTCRFSNLFFVVPQFEQCR